MMPEFEIEIREVYNKIVKVTAKNLDEAIEKVQMMYSDEEIVLDSSDFCETLFEKVE